MTQWSWVEPRSWGCLKDEPWSRTIPKTTGVSKMDHSPPRGPREVVPGGLRAQVLRVHVPLQKSGTGGCEDPDDLMDPKHAHTCPHMFITLNS